MNGQWMAFDDWWPLIAINHHSWQIKNNRLSLHSTLVLNYSMVVDRKRFWDSLAQHFRHISKKSNTNKRFGVSLPFLIHATCFDEVCLSFWQQNTARGTVTTRASKSNSNRQNASTQGQFSNTSSSPRARNPPGQISVALAPMRSFLSSWVPSGSFFVVTPKDGGMCVGALKSFSLWNRIVTQRG